MIVPITPDTSDAEIATGVAGANLTALVPALVHLTGDASLLDRFGARPRGPKGDAGLGYPDEQAGRIRAFAVQCLKDLRDGRLRPAAEPGPELMHRLLTWCAGENVDAGYVPLVREEACFEGRDLRRFEWSAEPPRRRAEFRVAIIGGGLAGVVTAIRLAEAGIPFTLIDKNATVGGTWLENDYPGCRVDVPSHFYSYSFEQSADWKDFYTVRPELAAYVERCADKYRLREHFMLSTEVLGARYDEADCTWELRLRQLGADGKERSARFNAVVSAVGMLNRPSTPDIPGLATFRGPRMHSAQWRDPGSLQGKRVAIIGTGASSAQIAPAIADKVEKLSIFQRAPHWFMPNPNYHRKVDEGTRWLLRHMPFYAGWHRFLLFWSTSDRIAPTFRMDPAWPRQDSINEPSDILRRAMTRHIEAKVGARPDLLQKVLPQYPPLGKRMLQDPVEGTGWYTTLMRDNVDLVTEPIREVVPEGVVTADGVLHPADILVLATGFYAGKFLWPMDIVGRGGAALQELWGEDPRAYLGITMPRFPNLFCLYGPNTNPLVGSVIFMLECQAGYIVHSLAGLLERNARAMECRQEVHDEYNRRLDAELEHMVWRHPRVHSYYNNSHGRVTTNAPWRLLDYWRMTRRPDFADFKLS
jgi:4-hydroxyacetophenone monooxygenase